MHQAIKLSIHSIELEYLIIKLDPRARPNCLVHVSAVSNGQLWRYPSGQFSESFCSDKPLNLGLKESRSMLSESQAKLPQACRLRSVDWRQGRYS